jgi:ribosomal protein L11 methyltransferase
MKFEIAVGGAKPVVDRLLDFLRRQSPGIEASLGPGIRTEERPRLLIIENEDGLDETLLHINRGIRDLGQRFQDGCDLDIRVRNLAYSEPPSGSNQFNEPFSPVPSITVQPWTPSFQTMGDKGTIVIDTNNAFGTGKHPTTKLCLEWIERFSRGALNGGWLIGREALDFGCGTGLLAVAAVKLGAKRALGVELDNLSVQTALRNVALNGLEDRIQILEGAWDMVRGTYDLILCNLVVSALLRTGDHIPKHLKKGGRLVVSGMGEAQAVEMETFFRGLDLLATHSSSYKGWASMVLKKRSSGY